MGRAAVHAMTHGDRLSVAGGDFAFQNLARDKPPGDAAEAEGWGLGFALSGTRRPPPQLESAPVFSWAGLHSLRFFASHKERLAAVALTQCHGFDAHCRDRCDELNRGLRDVAHSMLP